MRKEEWSNFFQFTRRETAGIMALLFLILLVFCLPALVNHFLPPLPQIRSVESERLVRNLEDTTAEKGEKDFRKSATASYDDRAKGSSKSSATLFVFDPNTLTDEGWLSLGLSERTVKTIRYYLSKGGKFRKADDIKRIYGLSPAMAEQLLPYVQIANNDNFKRKNFDSASAEFGQTVKSERKPKPLVPTSIDINKADSLEWLALDGIGPALTHRILKFRDKLGGFYSISQVGEVYGLPDSTFQKLLPKLRCAPGTVNRIFINTAEAALLEEHPYIRKKLARLLIAYRDQHGSYLSVSDLRKVQLIDSALLAKLVPYISVE